MKKETEHHRQHQTVMDRTEAGRKYIDPKISAQLINNPVYLKYLARRPKFLKAMLMELYKWINQWQLI